MEKREKHRKRANNHTQYKGNTVKQNKNATETHKQLGQHKKHNISCKKKSTQSNTTRGKAQQKHEKLWKHVESSEALQKRFFKQKIREITETKKHHKI